MSDPIDPSYRLLAARYFRQQAKRLAKQLDGARLAENIECVHKARVASRRLRAALRMFAECVPPKSQTSWRGEIRRITSGLGEARDKDVQIAYLQDALAAVDEKACYSGIARLLVQLEKQRGRLQPKVNKAIRRLRASGALLQMRAAGKKETARARKKQYDVRSEFSLQQAQRHILARVEEALPLAKSLADPTDIEGHHALRIAMKRLRYTSEIAQPVYAGRLDEAIKTVTRLQTLLGDIHDCDVWLVELDAFAEREKQRIVRDYGHDGPFAQLLPGIEHLRGKRRRHREEAFEQLAALWEQLQQQGFWESLTETVGNRA